jgi:predicted DNA binding protein
MATVMEFTSPASAFPLGSVFGTLPAATVELERLVPREQLLIPYFWVRGVETDDVEEAFDDHAGLHGVSLVDSVDSEYLLRAEWDLAYTGVLRAVMRSDIVVLGATGTSKGWTFEVRGESRDEIRAFREYCRAQDIQIDITAVHALLPIQSEGYELTEPQREALVLAHERGYFDSPRTMTLDDVATELDITRQSLSSLLRRGHRRLIGATLVGQ